MGVAHDATDEQAEFMHFCVVDDPLVESAGTRTERSNLNRARGLRIGLRSDASLSAVRNSECPTVSNSGAADTVMKV
jgi:hypothetical protein